MNQLRLFLVLPIIVFITTYAKAELGEYNEPNFCKVTKTTLNDYEPEIFSTSNNLLRRAGQEPIFCGERIIVHGRVLDQNCMPVPDAKVYVWQVNCKGKYPYTPLRNVAKNDLIDIDPHITFTGNGTATTNNNGEFVFITTYPASVHDLKPHINIRVEHYALGTLQSRLNLSGKAVKNPETKPELQDIADFVRQNGTNVYDFEIVLPGAGMKDPL
ncbi:MAG: dioxygenase [Rickettsiaceae bacterium]